MLSYRKVGNWHVEGGFRLILNICTELQYRCFSLGEERRVRRTILTIDQSVQFSPLTNCSISINFPPLIILLKSHCSLHVFTSTNTCLEKKEGADNSDIHCSPQSKYPLQEAGKQRLSIAKTQKWARNIFSCGGSRNLTFLVKTHIHFIC